MERAYGVKGLSKYATVRHNPEGAYGDVYGSMDLSSENDLVKAVIAGYMQGFQGRHHARRHRPGQRRQGASGVPAGAVPAERRGLGIAANGCPDEYLTYIDFFGNEGFPFSINYARRARETGPARYPGRVHHAAPLRRRDGRLPKEQTLQRHCLLRLHQWRHSRRGELLGVLLTAGRV